jgi:pimeloyl-ACP methyl ester carboxylesterase
VGREIGGSDGVTLVLDDAGEGTPVVGLHGLTATRRYVVMGSRALERAGHRVVLYDARGHGDSSPAEAYGYEQLAGDLEALLDGLQIERAVLAGASMGAHTALRFALAHPQRVAALCVITPGYDPATHPQGLEGWDALARGLREGGIDGFLAAYELDRVPEQWRETVIRVIRQRLAAHRHPAAVADALAAVPRSRPFESLAELGAIAAPAVVVGSRDEADPGHPLATARAYAAAIPGAELLVEDEGSSPLAWQGGRLSRVIADLAAKAAL